MSRLTTALIAVLKASGAEPQRMRRALVATLAMLDREDDPAT